MPRASSGPPLNTFVVRFSTGHCVWRERSAASAHWRGTIEHVQSGQRAAFLNLTKMAAFIRCLGIMIQSGDEGQLEEEDC